MSGKKVEIICISNFEDLLYKLFFEDFDADILFMNLSVNQIDFECLSFFEQNLQNSMSEIMRTSSCLDSGKGKIC